MSTPAVVLMAPECTKSPSGKHEIIQGAVAEYCRYCWIVPRYILLDADEPKPKPKPQSKSPSKKLRLLRLIYARDGRRCWWCGRILLPLDGLPAVSGRPPSDYPTLDHLQPQSKGGKWTVDNLVASCPECNNRRGNQTARYIPVDRSVEIHATTKCPDCENGVWASDGRFCPTCDGAGELSAARAVSLFVKQRNRRRSEQMNRVVARGEVGRLRQIIEDEMGVGAWRRDIARTVQRQRVTIESMADAILVLKVKLAEATGDDLRRMIPYPKSYERALQLVKERAS